MELCDLDRLTESCRGKDLVLDVFRDKSGAHGLSILVGDDHYFVLNTDKQRFDRFVREIHDGAASLACWELRKLVDLGMPLTKPVSDVKLLYGGESTLLRLAREHLGGDRYSELLQLDQKFGAHVRACKTAKVSLDRHSILRLVPPKFVQDLTHVRAKAIKGLLEKRAPDASYIQDTYPFALTLYRIERNGIKVNRDYVLDLLKRDDLPPADARVLKSMRDLGPNGYVHTLFNAAGGRTGRIKVESGFNCMGIPHGICRRALVSRFLGGEIVAFDFNAIDYRCIIQSTGDMELEGLYMDADDFHMRTTEKLFGKSHANKLRRKVIKQFTYVYAYGGTEETLSRKTGLSVPKCREVMRRLDPILYPVSTLRERMHKHAMQHGQVELPTGRVIKVPADAHPGMVLGLYAQSFSSYVFEKALQSAARVMDGMKSKILFTVHDEMVVDMYYPEHIRDVDIASAMEHAVDGYHFKVNWKKGKNYGEATD